METIRSEENAHPVSAQRKHEWVPTEISTTQTPRTSVLRSEDSNADWVITRKRGASQPPNYWERNTIPTTRDYIHIERTINIEITELKHEESDQHSSLSGRSESHGTWGRLL